jgi:hypothetical protein
MDQRPRGVVDPVDVLGLVVRCVKRRPAFELVGEGQDPAVPEGDVPQDTGNGPELVHVPCEVVRSQPRHQGSHPLQLLGVPFDVRPVNSHRFLPFLKSFFPSSGTANQSTLPNEAEAADFASRNLPWTVVMLVAAGRGLDSRRSYLSMADRKDVRDEKADREHVPDARRRHAGARRA